MSLNDTRKQTRRYNRAEADESNVIVVLLGPGGNNIHHVRSTGAINNTIGESLMYFLLGKSNALLHLADVLFHRDILRGPTQAENNQCIQSILELFQKL